MKKVISKDGTPIAFSSSGQGTPLIMVDGAFCRRTFGPMEKLAPFLTSQSTVICYDRRGRGDSGDNPSYAVDREIEDLAALINAVGGSANIFGMSSGAVLALRAIEKGLNIGKIAMYEPPFVVDRTTGHKPPADMESQLKKMIAAGRKSEAAKFFLTKVMGVPAAFYYIMRLLPMWSKMRDIARSLPYDAAIIGDSSIPEELVKKIAIPFAIIGGEKSPALLRTAVRRLGEINPQAQTFILKNQTHDVSPKALGPVLAQFFNQQVSSRKIEPIEVK